MGIPFLLCVSLLFSAICKASLPSTVIGFPEKVRNVRLIKAALRLLSRADGEGLVAFD